MLIDALKNNDMATFENILLTQGLSDNDYNNLKTYLETDLNLDILVIVFKFFLNLKKIAIINLVIIVAHKNEKLIEFVQMIRKDANINYDVEFNKEYILETFQFYCIVGQLEKYQAIEEHIQNDLELKESLPNHLILASYVGQANIVSYLLDTHSPFLNLQSTALLALSNAANIANTDMFIKIFRIPESRLNFHYKNYNLLMYLCQEGRFDMLKIVLESELLHEMGDDVLDSAFDTAVINQHFTSAKLISECENSSEFIKFKMACYSGNVDAINYHFSLKSIPNLLSYYEKVLVECIKQNKSEIIKLLILKTNLEDDVFKRYLEYAIIKNKPDVFKVLFFHFPNTLIEEINHKYFLELAILFNTFEVLKYLLSYHDFIHFPKAVKDKFISVALVNASEEAFKYLLTIDIDYFKSIEISKELLSIALTKDFDWVLRDYLSNHINDHYFLNQLYNMFDLAIQLKSHKCLNYLANIELVYPDINISLKKHIQTAIMSLSLQNFKYLYSIAKKNPDEQKYLEELMEIIVKVDFVEAFDYVLNHEIFKLELWSNRKQIILNICAFGSLNIFDYILSHKELDFDFSVENNLGFRAACQYGQLSMVERLLEMKDANIDYNAVNGAPLKLAVNGGHYLVVDKLLQLPNLNFDLPSCQAIALAYAKRDIKTVNKLRGYASKTAIVLNVNEILKLNNIVINYPHSVNAASIHKTVSQSAIKLMHRYAHEIEHKPDLTFVLLLIAQRLNNLDIFEFNFKPIMLEAAKRFILEALKPVEDSKFLFKDEISSLTTLQVLVLTYIALHDTNCLQHNVSHNQIFLSWVKSLYLARRGYNISDQGIDDELEDNAVCNSGTFNYIVESLNTLHVDVDVKFVTMNLVLYKFQPLVINQAIDILKSIRQNSLQEFAKHLNQLSNDGLCVIWDLISPQIKLALYDEFSDIFDNDFESEKLSDIIASGIYIHSDPIILYFCFESILNKHLKMYLTEKNLSKSAAIELISGGLQSVWPQFADKIKSDLLIKFPNLDELKTLQDTFNQFQRELNSFDLRPTLTSFEPKYSECQNDSFRDPNLNHNDSNNHISDDKVSLSKNRFLP